MDALMQSIVEKLPKFSEEQLQQLNEFAESLVQQVTHEEKSVADNQEKLTAQEFGERLDALAKELSQTRGPNAPVLSDYAISRAGIYEDHP